MNLKGKSKRSTDKRKREKGLVKIREAKYVVERAVSWESPNMCSMLAGISHVWDLS